MIKLNFISLCIDNRNSGLLWSCGRPRDRRVGVRQRFFVYRTWLRGHLQPTMGAVSTR